MSFMTDQQIREDLDRAKVTMIGLGNCMAVRIDWIAGRYDPHWVIRQDGNPCWLAQYSIRDVPDGLKAIQRYRNDTLATMREKHQ